MLFWNCSIVTSELFYAFLELFRACFELFNYNLNNFNVFWNSSITFWNSSLIIYMAGDKIDISAVLAHPRGPIKEPANTSTR